MNPISNSHPTRDPSAPDQYLKLSDGACLRFVRQGTGPTALVFIPGWTMQLESFEHQLDAFKGDTRFTTIAYDPRSQGKSSVTVDGNFYAQHARDLRELLDHVGSPRCVLIGWSAGSADIIEYLRAYGSDRVEGIVLIDIPPKSRGYDTEVEWAEFGTKDGGDQDGQLRTFCHDLLIDRERVTDEFCAWMLEDPNPEAVAFFRSMSLCTPAGIAAQLNMSYWFVDGEDVIAGLDDAVPMLFVVRREKEVLATKWTSSHRPGAWIDAFGNHAMFWENADRFNHVLQNFLDSISLSSESQG